jgi:outer membrane murein-binding lipoprotein Lpp
VVAKDLLERNEEAKPAPLVVQIAGPAAPKIDQYESTIAALNGQIAALKKPPSAVALAPQIQAEPSGPNNAQLADSAKELAPSLRRLQDEINQDEI